MKTAVAGSRTSVDQMENVQHVDGIKHCVVKGEPAWKAMRAAKMDCAIDAGSQGKSVARGVRVATDTFAVLKICARDAAIWVPSAVIKVSAIRIISVGTIISAHRVDGWTVLVVRGIRVGRGTSVPH